MSRFVVRKFVEEPIEADVRQVLSLTEAAKMLGLSVGAVAGLCLRGALRWLQDTHEPNPRKRGRVLREDVVAELNRRSGMDDGRIKRKQGRHIGG